ncbi:hypothetical protein E2C01_079095 [Portunus trituberculatus]|uniref:Uncharacterized protein n=1 Tax=Portunus trituberculatus TaxID=210409 RepID=A0A5B7ISD5_PORTR|nr:hypothetical protein [Portunus trituberculatus]
MAVVSVLAAKVDNLSATVSGLSNEFAAFKNQEHTVCSGTSTVAPTPSPTSGAQRGQGESDVYQHTLIDTPTKPVKGATQQSQSPSGMAPAFPASKSKSPEADCDKDAAGEWTLVSCKKKRCSSPNPAQTASAKPDQGHLMTASPEPDQQHLMAGIQILTEQMSHLTQEVDGLKTQMQHHHDKW